MSQWSNPYNQTEEMFAQPPRKTSGLAITALVLSLTGIIPCCGIVLGPIGALLGLIAVISITGNPAMKGRGLAAAAIVLGLLLVAIQVALGWKYVVEPMMSGPRDALIAGFNGNISEFKDRFVGPAATASDAEAQAFIDELRNRYGEFQAVEFRGDTGNKPSQESSLVEYRLIFANATVRAEAEMVFYHERSRRWMRLGSLRIIDTANGDLIYPSEPSSPASTTAPPATSPDASVDE